MTILVTGGAGYIGSHTSLELLQSGHEVVIVDNFSNSQPEAVRRIEALTGKTIRVYRGDVQNKPLLTRLFNDASIDAVIHFAGLKAVGESVQQPLLYYQVNLGTTLALCEVMQAQGVKKLLFSSSATVYGTAPGLPWTENTPTGRGISHPYGKTKYLIEQFLSDLVESDPSWAVTCLRYFNPIGAHESGDIGEDPRGIPNNLMPYITQVAVGKRDKLHIFGGDYDTPDGTAIRDYIHVVDVAKGHVAALKHLQKGMHAYNLGSGKGVSVLEAVRAFEKASGRAVPYEIVARRPGDLAMFYADASKAQKELGWRTEKSFEDACRDAWRWQSQNPDGFRPVPTAHLNSHSE
ncbi:MAG TPA: UDP-glucose 4-epimerase GalE [Verrucomicrobiae bacterium]|nr:UDP-glucose 4-epimerase GalE [Verrucomicrobiae bacterium]